MATPSTRLVPWLDRTFEFAVRVVNLCTFMDGRTRISRRLADQLLRSGTSVGANVEEGQAAETIADFIHKYQIALKEGRETSYWLRLIARTGQVPAARLKGLTQEAEEIKKILGASVNSARRTQKARKTRSK